MIRLTLLLSLFLGSLNLSASCGSKMKSRLHRNLAKQGTKISISHIKVSHKEHLELDQGAYIKVMDRFELEANGRKFYGLSSQHKKGCKVESLKELEMIQI